MTKQVPAVVQREFLLALMLYCKELDTTLSKYFSSNEIYSTEAGSFFIVLLVDRVV